MVIPVWTRFFLFQNTSISLGLSRDKTLISKKKSRDKTKE